MLGIAELLPVGTPMVSFLKMDLSGNLIWKRVFNCNNLYLWAQALTEAANGNYQVFGTFNSGNYQDNYAIEFNSMSGVTVWDSIYARNSFSNSWDESFFDAKVHSLNNATYTVGRFQTAAGQGSYRPSLTKFKPTGEMEWSKTYLYPFSSSGGRLYSYSLSVDGDSLVMGLLGRNGGNNPPFQCGLIKTDTSGNINWSKLYTGANGQDLRSYNIINTPNGYLLGGWIQNGNKDLFLIKTDKQGNVIWSKSYGGTGDEDVYQAGSNSRIILDGNEIITVGRTDAFGGGFDIFMVRVDLSSGDVINAGCSNDLAIIQSNLPSYQTNYPMVRSTLPITSTDPVIVPTDIIMDQGGNLVENVSDTLIGGDTVYLCPGEDITVRADWNPSLTYLWNTGGTSQTETLSVSGTYWVDVSGGGCIVWSDTVYVVVGTLNVDLGSDTTLCDNPNPVLLDATTPGVSYLWQDGSTNATFSASSSGTYWVQVDDGLGCTGSDTIEIQYGNVPVFSLGNDTTLCQGETILLDATTTGASYLWQDNSTANTYNVNSGGTYWVEVTANGCTSSDTVIVQYNPIPIVNLGNDTVLCDLSTLTLDATTTAATYSWQDGSTNPTFNAVTSGSYWVEVNLNGCSSSDTINVQYSTSPVVNLGNDTTLCQGETILLDATTTGASYLWQDNSTANTYNVNSGGTYWVEVSTNGCTSSDTVIVQYNPTPIVDLGNDTTLCGVTSFLLDANYPTSTYLWQDGSTNASYTVNSSGTFWVTLSIGTCVASDTINLQFSAEPQVDLGNDTTICESSAIVLDATTTGATYTWQDVRWAQTSTYQVQEFIG